MNGMNSVVFKAGVQRVIHIFVPNLHAMQEKNDPTIPIWAVRSEKDGYRTMILGHSVEGEGTFKGVTRPDMPLPGTKGRGIAPMVVEGEIVLHFYGETPTVITFNDDEPEAAPAKPVVAERWVEYAAKSGNRNVWKVVKDNGDHLILAGKNGAQFPVNPQFTRDVPAPSGR